jgi:hypothetical protein
MAMRLQCLRIVIGAEHDTDSGRLQTETQATSPTEQVGRE